VDTDLRASLVAAAAAAVLSALVGILAGVGFLAILLRAALGGALFGALVYGCLLFARRSLPGLSGGAEEARFDTAPYDAEDRGRNVDITLPGEAPAEAASVPAAGEAGPPEFPVGAEAAASDIERTPASAPESETLLGSPSASRAGGAATATPESLAPLVGAAEEPAAASMALPSYAAAARRAPPAAVAVEADEAEDLASLIGPDESDRPAAAIPAAGAPGISSLDDLDVLPDLDGFSDSFAPAEIRGVAEEPSASPRFASSRAAAGPVGSMRTESLDPASLAQAVRTILKRDQKG